MLEDSLFLVEVTEERGDYIAKVTYKEASVIVNSRDRAYPHILTIINQLNLFLGDIDTDKRLYLWPLLEDETVVFAQEPDKLFSFHEAGGYSPLVLNSSLSNGPPRKFSLKNLSGCRTRVSFDDVKHFRNLNQSFVSNLNYLQKETGKNIIPSERAGLFKNPTTGQILIVANDQVHGSLFLDAAGIYMYGIGHSLLVLQDILLNWNNFKVKHVNVMTKEEVLIERDSLLVSIQALLKAIIK